MTNREKEIFELIKQNPSITQKEISEKLNLTRTSVAVHITHIAEKGYILGRAYIIRKKPEILVIGACNVDVQGIPTNNFEMGNSNIGKVKITNGGVGHNIAVNVNRIQGNVKLITALSNDVSGKRIAEEFMEAKIDIDDSKKTDQPSSIYLSILDKENEMMAGISDMDLIKTLDLEFIKSKKHIIEEAENIVIDTNINEDVINYILDNKKDSATVYVDTVSAEKAAKIGDRISKVDILKTNRMELEAIVGRKLKKISEIKSAAQELLDKGLKKIFITLGHDGVIYGTEKRLVKLSNPKNLKVVDVNGAGDMFMAALIYANLIHLNTEKMAKFAQCAAIYKVGIHGTVPEGFCIDAVKDEIGKYYPELMRGESFDEIF